MATLLTIDGVIEGDCGELVRVLRTLPFRGELWLELGEDGPMMCGLVAIDQHEGWLMFLRYPGDAGFATRNPQTTTDQKARFRLANGQVDPYPLAWCYPIGVLREAFIEMATTKQRPTNVVWDSDD